MLILNKHISINNAKLSPYLNPTHAKNTLIQSMFTPAYLDSEGQIECKGHKCQRDVKKVKH